MVLNVLFWDIDFVLKPGIINDSICSRLLIKAAVISLYNNDTLLKITTVALHKFFYV